MSARVSANPTLAVPLKETLEAVASPLMLKSLKLRTAVAVSALPVKSPSNPSLEVVTPIIVTPLPNSTLPFATRLVVSISPITVSVDVGSVVPIPTEPLKDASPNTLPTNCTLVTDILLLFNYL